MRAVLLALLTLAAACPGPRHPELRFLAEFPPPPEYFIWATEVANCVRILDPLDSTWTSERLDATPDSIVWVAVPSERPDGSFEIKGLRYLGLRIGAVGADTIFVSGQHMLSKSLIKHELMHVYVNSETERTHGAHGPPWGLCEFV